MSRSGPVSRAVSVGRDNFQPGITWGEPARLMADALKRVRPMAGAMKHRRPDAMKRGRPCLILVRTRHEPLDILQREVVVFKTDTTRMRRMIAIAFFQQLAALSSAFMGMDFHFCFFYIERGILICWRLTLRGREIYLLRSIRNWNYPLYSRWLNGPGWPGKRDYMEKFQPGCHVIAKLSFVAFNKRGKIPANWHQPGSCNQALRNQKTENECLSRAQTMNDFYF